MTAVDDEIVALADQRNEVQPEDAGGGARGQGTSSEFEGARNGSAGVTDCEARGRAGRFGPDLSRCWVRMARVRMLDVPGDES